MDIREEIKVSEYLHPNELERNEWISVYISVTGHNLKLPDSIAEKVNNLTEEIKQLIKPK